MVYHKLEEAIKAALEGQCFGNNKIVVETTTLEEVFIFELDESLANTTIAKLEDEVYDLRLGLDTSNTTIAKLEEKLREYE